MVVYYCKNILQIGGAELLLSYEVKTLLSFNKRVSIYIKKYDLKVVKELGLEDVVINKLRFLELLQRKSVHVFFIGGIETLYLLSWLKRDKLYLCDHHPITCKPLNTERGYLQRRIGADPILSTWNQFNRHYEYPNRWNILQISWFLRHLMNKKIYKSCTSLVLSDMAVYEKKLLYDAVVQKLVPSNFFIKTPTSIKERLVLIISRLEKSKRVDFLLDAFIKSHLYQSGFVCKVLGTGSLESSLKVKYELETQIQFLGYTSDTEKNRCLQKAQVLLNGQVADFNLTEIEARSNHCAYISPGMRNDSHMLTYLPNDQDYLVYLIENFHVVNEMDKKVDERVQYLIDTCY